MLKKILSLCLLLFTGHSPKLPPAAPTIGFFLDSWQPKTFKTPAAAPSAVAGQSAVTPRTATISIDPDSTITRIPLSEFGHNAVTWMGPTANQPGMLTDLTNLHPHIIRWPAGSGSDVYFWNCGPGQIPADVPWMMPDKDGKKKAVSFFLGKPTGHTLASLDDYYAMLRSTGNEGLITVNYGYARYGTSANPVATAAHLAAQWVRYDHGRTHYWEIGNENYGSWEQGYRIDTTTNKDGQPAIISGDLYARHFIVFADSMRAAAAQIGATIYIGAVTHEAPGRPWEPPATQNWNSTMIKALHDMADYYVVHNYFTPYSQNSSAAEILKDAETIPAEMMTYVQKCLRESGAAIKPVAMDEWNMFAIGSRQQVSNISGIFGVIVLGEALKNKYGLAARWDLMNGWAGGNDHGLFSAGDEPGVQRWTPRPSFYYLYYMQRLMGDRLIAAHVTGDTGIRAYASAFSSGELSTALVNTGTTPSIVTIDTRDFKPRHNYYWYSLQGGDDNGEFSGKVFVNGKGPAGSVGGPEDYATLKANAASVKPHIRVTVPARGAVFLVIDTPTSSE